MAPQLRFHSAWLGRPAPLRWHLIRLSLATMIPLLIFAVVMIIRLVDEERATFERGATERTRAVLTAVDTELRSSIATLEALAASGNLDNDRLRAFYEEAARVIKTQPNWFTVNLADLNGQQLMNLQWPFGVQLPTIVEESSFSRIVRSGKPTAGNVAQGPIEKRYGFTVRVPVTRDRAVKYVLTAVVNPQSIRQLVLAQKLPPDWVGVVLDGNRRFVARTIQPEQNVGQLASDSLRAALNRAPEAWFRGLTLEGWDVYTAYSRSEFSGWTVALGIPADVVNASLQRSFLFVAGFGVLLLTVGAILTWFFGSRTARIIESLSRLAENPVSEKARTTSENFSTRIAEVEKVRNALLEDKQLLDERSRERDRVEAALRQTTEWLELAQESAEIGVFERNLTTHQIKWSVSQETLYGLSPGSFGGQHSDWAERVHPEDLPAVEAAVRECAKTLSPVSTEFRVVRPGGRVRWIASKARILTDEKGAASRMVGVNIDITDRREREKALAQAARQKEALYQFVERRYRAGSLEELHEAALDAILAVLGCQGAAILLYDDAQVMRFVASRGLSEDYRKAVECHSPWRPIDPNPEPVCMSDTEAGELDENLKAELRREGIGALAFIPLLVSGKLAGKFMVYYDSPHSFDSKELELTLTIALQLALSIERKRAEDALRQSRTELADLFDTASQGIHWVDRKGIILRANRAELNMLGYSEAEYIGRHIGEFHADAEVCTDIMRRLSCGETLQEYPARMKCRDGTVRDVVINSSVYWQDGQFVHTRCFTRDVTEIKQAEEARSRLAAIVESSEDAIIGKSLDGLVATWNAGAERLFGYRAEEIIGRPITTIIPPKRQEEETVILARLQRGERVKQYETIRIRKNGSPIDVSVTISPMKDAQGNIIGVSKIARDISERKRAEEALRSVKDDLMKANERLEARVRERTGELERANAALVQEKEMQQRLEAQLRQSQKMESLGTLAGGIAHEFNNVLNIIKGYALLARKGPAAPERIDHTLKVIDEAVERGASVVRQLLTLARKADTHFAATNVGDVVMELSELLKGTFPKNIEILLELSPDGLAVMADATQLSQAILNLCLNARDAMPHGGRLAIRTRLVDSAGLKDRHVETTSAQYACVEIADTGIGIDPSVQSRVFEPFFTTKSIGEGSGLGLAIVYGIVSTHNGLIDVESEPGRGASFKMYLPAVSHLAARSERTIDAESIKETLRQGRATILLAEDEKMMSELLKRKLSQRGYDVLIARDGKEAVDLYHCHYQQIALVLLDLGLPKLGGFEVTAQLKQANPNVKIIITSGYIKPELRSRLCEEGVQEFVDKPYLPSQIIKIVEQLLAL